MPVCRATFFFEDTNKHGWTETIFSTKATLDSCMEAAQNLLPKRVACLGNTSFLPFIRVSDDLVKRDSVIYSVPSTDSRNKDPGIGGSDIANTSLVIRLQSSPLTRRTLYMRGIPDGIVTDSGEYNPSGSFRVAVALWIAELVKNGWSCKSRIGVNVPHPIANVTQDMTTGIVEITTADNHGLVANDGIVISRVTGATQINSTTSVRLVVNATKFTINSSVIVGLYNGGGQVEKLGYALANITSGQVMRVSHRNAGRPFDSPRGRRSRRRKA